MTTRPEHAGATRADHITVRRCNCGCTIYIELRDEKDAIFAIAPFDPHAAFSVVEDLTSLIEACVGLGGGEGAVH